MASAEAPVYGVREGQLAAVEIESPKEAEVAVGV
jgi:hypothetical protein